MTRIRLENIHKSFKGESIFERVDLQIGQGELIAIKGKSGVGKSTLLNILAGLETASSGAYYFNDVLMTELTSNALARIRGESIGYIAQNSPMIAGMSAFDNICAPFMLGKNKIRQDQIQKLEELSERFEIKHVLKKKVGKLSGGQIQRVGVIRALLKNPEFIIADEPTGSLDDDTAHKVMDCFKDYRREGSSIVLATHSNLVAEECDKVYELTRTGLS